MNLNNVHSKEFEGFPLKHDAADWTDVIPDAEWDDIEVQTIATDLIGRRDEEY